MANILFLESDPLAIKAFTGIIHRSVHHMRHAARPSQAFEMLANGPLFHILVMEIKLSEGSGQAVISSIRSNPFLSPLPILVYTKAHDRETVRKITSLGVQNYLIKPYEDDKLFAEISRATNSPWWKKCFEPPEVILAKAQPPAASVPEVHGRLLSRLDLIQHQLDQWKPEHYPQLRELSNAAIHSGFPALSQVIERYLEQDPRLLNPNLPKLLESLHLARRLLEESAYPGKLSRFDPTLEEPSLTTPQPQHQERTPTGNKDDIFRELSELRAYPIIESVAASFQMAAANPDIEVETLSVMILSDPCLSVEVFYHVNHASDLAQKTEDGVRDQKHAIQLLGLSRIRKMAQGFITFPDNFAGDLFDWKKFRTFQLACGLLAEDMVTLLSLQLDPARAYFAGLVHQLGKILLIYLYPSTYAKALKLAKDQGLSIPAAERHYFGCTQDEAGAYFAELAKFPEEVVDCIRHGAKPENAPPRSSLFCALISLAHRLCDAYKVTSPAGISTPITSPLVGSTAWEIIRSHAGPAFSLTRFENDIRSHLRAILQQISGLARLHIHT